MGKKVTDKDHCDQHLLFNRKTYEVSIKLSGRTLKLRIRERQRKRHHSWHAQGLPRFSPQQHLPRQGRGTTAVPVRVDIMKVGGPAARLSFPGEWVIRANGFSHVFHGQEVSCTSKPELQRPSQVPNPHLPRFVPSQRGARAHGCTHQEDMASLLQVLAQITSLNGGGRTYTKAQGDVLLWPLCHASQCRHCPHLLKDKAPPSILGSHCGGERRCRGACFSSTAVQEASHGKSPTTHRDKPREV